jgi:radical SAM protein with 4Fe4S-binding SPASM domain
MPFCYSPWTNIDISPTGDISPCCKFQTESYLNISSSSIEDYQNSELLGKVKESFKNNTWPPGCERCRIEETNQIESKRLLDYTRWKDQYSNYNFDSGFITASIAFGNTCNLKCITCNPESSSRWRKEHLDLFGTTIEHVKFFKKDFVEDFTKQAPNLVHIDIPGGEPFLSGIDEQKKLLAYYVSTGSAGNITIHYTTNATIFPDNEWWDLLSYFKEVDMQLSIDGVGAHYEYIRYPGNWDILVQNVEQYLRLQHSNVRLSVSHTLSAYNVFYLDEFFTWCYNTGLPKPWVGRVHNPRSMRPTVWPAEARMVIANKLLSSQHHDVVTWGKFMLKEDDSNYFLEFKKRMVAHDQYRDLSFTNTFKELGQFL